MTSSSLMRSPISTQQSSVRPPPLPPRQSEPSISGMAAHDPRSSSTQSLVPSPGAEQTYRRTLLLVYIHGFMGDETSFQSFPAHLHNLLTITMAESHVVHTKIYPKYRSRYALEVARDEFSNWLTPHESPFTDVILLGHSMGGLLAADIALLLRHNIIGVVNFDVPFLGMHPGIVKAGLGSIFNPWPGPENPVDEDGKRPSRMNTFFNPKPSDPNYNPAFPNDVHLPVRKGWENALHFMNKHSSNLIAAGKGLVKSHIQFGGAMADYPTLKARYARIRALEEDNEDTRRSANPETAHPPRIRFVNYYTASTGRPKKPKSPKSPSPSRPASRGLTPPNGEKEPIPRSSLALTQDPTSNTGTISPRISVDEYRENEVVPVSPEEPLSATSPVGRHSFDTVTTRTDSMSDLQEVPPMPHEALSATPSNEEGRGVPGSASPSTESGPELPEIPPIPTEPPFVDLLQYPDKAERKAAEKAHSQALKEYRRAVKARNAVIKERSKAEEKWQKQQEAQRLKAAKEEKVDSAHNTDHVEQELRDMQLGPKTPDLDTNSNSPYTNYAFSRSVILAHAPPDGRSPVTESSAASMNTSYADSTDALAPQTSNEAATQDSSSKLSPKKKRYKKFCMLPPKDSDGNKDPTWIRIFMENMDEVVAHTSLFFPSETYETLVGDVGARIEGWVSEYASAKLAREIESYY